MVVGSRIKVLEVNSVLNVVMRVRPRAIGAVKLDSVFDFNKSCLHPTYEENPVR